MCQTRVNYEVMFNSRNFWFVILPAAEDCVVSVVQNLLVFWAKWICSIFVVFFIYTCTFSHWWKEQIDYRNTSALELTLHCDSFTGKLILTYLLYTNDWTMRLWIDFRVISRIYTIYMLEKCNVYVKNVEEIWGWWHFSTHFYTENFTCYLFLRWICTLYISIQYASTYVCTWHNMVIF